MMAKAQHEGVELLARLTLLGLDVIPGPGQIPDGLLLGIGDPHQGQVPAS